MRIANKSLLTKEYRFVYLNNVLETLSLKYQVDSQQLSVIRGKFIAMINKDPEHIFHFNSEYWADFIAEASELEMKCGLNI
jgi:hypothetical protein